MKATGLNRPRRSEFLNPAHRIGSVLPAARINDATFGPVPDEELMSALGELEKFWHTPSPLPLLIRLALIHYQFEAIHPWVRSRFVRCLGFREMAERPTSYD